MTSVLSFLKRKSEDFEKNEVNNLHQKIENLSIKDNISMAQSAQSLNVLQSLKVLESLNDFTTPAKNDIKEEGFKFKDGSIILKLNGRLNGLSIQESDLWSKGIYFKRSIEVSIFEELNNNKILVETANSNAVGQRKLSF